jgi:hypothetical protein
MAMANQLVHAQDSMRWPISRRAFLSWSTAGLGAIALAELLGREARGDEPPRWEGAARPLPLPAKAKRVIQLYMAGGPSQLETFDCKPKLAALQGKPIPESIANGQAQDLLAAPGQTHCLAPQFAFAKVGRSGQEISELLPNLRRVADDICIIRSMRGEAISHAPAHLFMNTGSTLAGRPSMGSWLYYGLGSETNDLPGFVVLTTAPRGIDVPSVWHSGFLPSRFQGVKMSSTGEPILYLKRPPGVSADSERSLVETVNGLNRLYDGLLHDPETATRIVQYEKAFRMQTAVPELTDFSRESKEVQELYGAKPGDGSFGSACLLARRLAERGVRYVQIVHRDWDHHKDLRDRIQAETKDVDQGMTALVTDLKRQGMLDDTLVIWGGEFGRTPTDDPVGKDKGRTHHSKGFSIWLAGGGVKAGITHGATDELGFNAVEDVVDVHDLHATILHVLGIDHKRLTYRFQGRDFRLTDIAGNVVHKILA